MLRKWIIVALLVASVALALGAPLGAQGYPPKGLAGLTALLPPTLARALPHAVTGPRAPKQWTFMVYLDGDNNLAPYADLDLQEMEQVGSNADIDIVVLRDLDGNGDSEYDYVNLGSVTMVQDLGEVNMGDPATLQGFMTWGITNYPADRYALILWDHGGGWRAPGKPGKQRIWKAACWDDTNGGDCLYTAEQSAAIQGALDATGTNLEMLGYDVCLAGMIEIIHEMSSAGLAGRVHAIAGSPPTEPGDGWPYHTVLGDLAADPGMGGVSLADSVVTRYYEFYGNDWVAMSSYDLTQAATASTAISTFADEMMVANEWSMIVAARAAGLDYYSDFIDLRQFAQYVETNASGGALQLAATNARQSLDALVHSYFCGGGYSSGLGLAVYFPAWSNVDPDYNGTIIRWAADTDWDEFIRYTVPVEEDQYEPDDTWDQANPITTHGTLQHRNNASVAHKYDWAYFQAKAGAQYVIRTSNLGSNADTYLYLYGDPPGASLAEDDDSGGDLSSLITWLCPTAGRYYVMERPYSDSRVGAKAKPKPRPAARLGIRTGLAATYDLSVTGPPNQPPVAVDDAYTTEPVVPLTVNAPGVLGNDTDGDGDPFALTWASNPQHGTLIWHPDGSFIYDPDDTYHGPDSFQYKANDGTDDSNAATVTITVLAPNTPPVAVDDSCTVTEDQTLTITAPGVLGNDTDAESDPLTAVWVSDPPNGALTLNANGSFTYTPHGNFNGTDSFQYKANDGRADSNAATVTITVTPVNDPPTVADDSYAVNEEETLNVTAPGVLGNDTDPESDPMTLVWAGTPQHGSLTWEADGSFTYDPVDNYSGPDSFEYKASDGKGRRTKAESSPATVRITIIPVNDLPVAVDDSYTVDEDTTVTVAAPGVLGNDSDIDGDVLTAVSVSAPSHGALTLRADGSLVYRAHYNWNGSDSFTYKAFDGTDDSNVVTVTITVNPTNDPPRQPRGLQPKNRRTGLPCDQDLSWRCTDRDGDQLTYAVYFGTTMRPPQVASGLTTASYDPGLLQANRRYYWKVKATDPSGETSVGRLVCFVTGSGVASEPPDVVMAQTLQITGLSALPTRGGQAAIQFSLSAAASVTVRILNAAGRPVRTVCQARNCDAGTDLMLWDCRTDGGLSAPNGTYLVEMIAASPDGSRSRAITTVRRQR